MFHCHAQPEIPGEAAVLKLGVDFDEIDRDFSSRGGLLALSQIDHLHACSTLQFDEQSCEKIPGLSEMVVTDRDVEFPVVDLVAEFVLGVPVDSAEYGVQFDEAVVAEGLVVVVLGYGVAVGLEEFVTELFGKGESCLWFSQVLAFEFFLHFRELILQVKWSERIYKRLSWQATILSFIIAAKAGLL